MVFLVLLAGCGGRSRSCDSWSQGDIAYYDSGGWRDTGGWYDDWYGVEIGIGTNRFLSIPYDRYVAPELVPDEEGLYYNVALRGWGLEQEDLEVVLEAYVGTTRYAADAYGNVDMRCIRWDESEVSGLRLHLDPATLPEPPPPPPPPPTPVDEPPAPVDSGWWWDSGIAREEPDTGATYIPYRDTGYAYVEPQGDVRIVATVTAPNGVRARGESWWLVYR
ncbi:MAG: hypothetical protein H6736_17845 [Alphaproteobacteria bacterium]|nr:hypothetical protein [Alphaproteobacteria bacterium]